jgi:hypothetical protein
MNLQRCLRQRAGTKAHKRSALFADFYEDASNARSAFEVALVAVPLRFHLIVGLVSDALVAHAWEQYDLC